MGRGEEEAAQEEEETTRTTSDEVVVGAFAVVGPTGGVIDVPAITTSAPFA